MRNTSNLKNIALTGGATGGHVFPLLAIYKYLENDKNLHFIWFGEEGGLESIIAREYGIPFEHVPAGKIRRYFDLRNLIDPFKNISGIFFSIYYLLKYKINIIISKGGYVSFPLCLAGFLLRKKIYIHESDNISGISNRIIAKMATKVFYTFDNDKIDGKKHILTGQILNPELIENIDVNDEVLYDEETGEEIIFENEKLEVLVIGGSQGSKFIFESLKNFLNNLIDINFTIILGDKNLNFRKDFENYKNVTLYDFVPQKELGKIYQKTDITITRGGATTLWELYYFGIHSIIIPLPTSAQNHQEKNAYFFKEKFGSDIIIESNDTSLKIYRLLERYKELRKNCLNLDDFKYPLNKIKREIF